MTLDQFLSAAEVKLPVREEMVKTVAKMLFSNICSNDNTHDEIDDLCEEVANEHGIEYWYYGFEQVYYEILEHVSNMNDYDFCNNSVFSNKLGEYYICYEDESDTEQEIVKELKELVKEEVGRRCKPYYLKELDAAIEARKEKEKSIVVNDQ